MVSGKLRLKPVRGHGDPIPVGEDVDSPAEEKRLQKYAHVDLESIKEANSEETEKSPTPKPDAETPSTEGAKNKLPPTHRTIKKIVERASPEVKAGVRDFYQNLGAIKASPPSPAEISKIVQANPDDDKAIVDSFHSTKPQALTSMLKVLKPLSKNYVKAAGIAGLVGLAVVSASVIPAIFAVAYLAQKLDDKIEAKHEAKDSDSSFEDEATEQKQKAYRKLVESKRASLTKPEFKKWKDEMDNLREAQGLPALSSHLSLSHSEEDDGIVTLVHDFDHWFKTIDADKLMQDSKVVSTSAAGLRLILSPTLKYFKDIHHKQYLLVVGNDLIGTVNWDDGMGDPHPDVYGWKATMRDGFPESSFHTGRDPDNKFAPYTVIHKGEVKLHNPTRMNLDTAFSWAKSIYKGMQDAKQEEDELGDSDPESEL